MQSELDAQGGSTWKQLSPLLDEAMLRLGQTDRDALVLRFFEGRSLNEVGHALGANEEAAKKRVNRALEKLRNIFAKRGVSSTTAIIAETISAHSVQAAPVALAKAATAAAITKGAAASGSTLTLIKGALKIMAWTKAKTAVIVGMGVLLTAGTATIAVNEFTPHKTPSAPPAEMKIRWLAGKTYAMRAEIVETVESKSSGQPQSFKQSVNLTQDYTLSVRKELDNGGRQLEFAFTGETMDVSLGGRKVSSFDSKQDSARDGRVPMSVMLRKQLGTRFQYFTDADGQVERIEGLEELMRQIGTIGTPQDRATFQQMFSGDILKEYASFGEMMPNRPVAIGDHWRKTKDFVSPVGIVATDVEYTFKSWEQHPDHKCMRIAVAGNISAKPDAMGQNSPQRNIKGKFAGDAWFDPALGMIVDANYDQNIAIETMNRGQAFPLQITEKIRFTLVDVQ
jgi:hypothetical protein